MNSTARRPPFARILRQEQGRTQVWLARETGVSTAYVKAVAAGLEKGSPRWRAACARAMQLPESVLFLDHGASEGSRSAHADGSDAPDGTSGSAGLYQIREEVAIRRMA